MDDKMKKEQYNVIMYPYELSGNAFIEIRKKMLANNGIKCYCMREAIKRPAILKTIDAIDFNWFETLHSNSILKCFFIFIMKILIIFLMKINDIKIIYTIHNRRSHNKTVGLGLEKMLRKILLLSSDAIVVLCDETKKVIKDEYTEDFFHKIENKIWIQHHPNYLNYYKEPEKKDIYKINAIPRPMVLLSLGGISPYKNIEMIISVAKEFSQYPIIFLIAGACKETYEKELRNKAKEYNNIILDTKFIPDDDVLKYIYCADAMLLPYHMDSSLNSGACILGLTYGKNIICPEIGTVKEFPNGLIFTYTYSSEKEHKERLQETIKKAYLEWKYDPSEYFRKGSVLQTILKKEYDQNFLGRNYRKMLDKVV